MSTLGKDDRYSLRTALPRASCSGLLPRLRGSVLGPGIYPGLSCLRPLFFVKTNDRVDFTEGLFARLGDDSDKKLYLVTLGNIGQTFADWLISGDTRPRFSLGILDVDPHDAFGRFNARNKAVYDIAGRFFFL